MTTNVMLSSNVFTVTISTTKIENILNKKLVRIPTTISGVGPGYPLDLANANVVLANSSRMTDVLDIRREFFIEGHITTGLSTGAWEIANANTAKQKKSYLLAMFAQTGVKSLEFEGTSYWVQIEKLQIIEIPTDEDTEPSIYDVKMNLIQGIDST